MYLQKRIAMYRDHRKIGAEFLGFLATSHRQLKNESRAAAKLRLDQDAASSPFDNALDYRQTQSGAGNILHTLTTIKGIECPPSFFWQHAETIVRYLQFVTSPDDTTEDANVGRDVVPAILHAVFNQVPQHLPEETFVVSHAGRLDDFVKARRVAEALGEIVADLRGNDRRVARCAVGMRVCTSKGEEVVDHRRDPLDAAAHAIERGRFLAGRFSRHEIDRQREGRDRFAGRARFFRRRHRARDCALRVCGVANELFLVRCDPIDALSAKNKEISSGHSRCHMPIVSKRRRVRFVRSPDRLLHG